MIQEVLTARTPVVTNGTAPSRGRLTAHYRALVQRIKAASMAAPATQSLETIGVTSCERGAGVSTVAFNVAVAAARADMGSVLLVDADITKRSHRVMIPEPPTQGLADALADVVDPMDCVAGTSIENLSVVVGRGKAKHDDLHFDPFRAARLLNEYKRHFKLLVVDIPAPTELNGSEYLAAKMDGVLLVIESELSDCRAALRTKQQLVEARANILGVILNKQRNYLPNWCYRFL